MRCQRAGWENRWVSTTPSPSVQAQTGARRREATQAEIIDATKRLLLAGESFSRLSIERIAKEASVSRATVYLHFADKKDILGRLAHGIVQQRFALGAEMLADSHIQRETLDRIVADMVQRWTRDAPLLDAIIELADQDPVMRATWASAIQEVAAMGADLMRKRSVDGRSAIPDPDTLGQVLAWMFERSAHQLTREPDRRPAVIAAIAEVLWRVFDYQPQMEPTPRSRKSVRHSARSRA
jgi:AcrR family transcriptional regulator